MKANVDQSSNGHLIDANADLPPDVVAYINKMPLGQRQLLIKLDKRLRAQGKPGFDASLSWEEWGAVFRVIEENCSPARLRRDREYKRWLKRLNIQQLEAVEAYVKSGDCPRDWDVKHLRRVLNIVVR